MEFASVADVRIIELPSHKREDGELVVMEEGKALPYAAARVFTVRATENAVRGRHAHKRCNQFFVCVHGIIDVECDDGANKARFLLDAGNKALFVPASIWASETYKARDSILAVLCDRVYEEDDYLRDYEQFLAWRKGCS